MSDTLITNQQFNVDRDKITRAVKEALDDKKMDDISAQLTALATQMATGFAQVHTRQDNANGKLMAHDLKITAIEGKSNYDKIVWLLVTSLLGVVVYFVTKSYS